MIPLPKKLKRSRFKFPPCSHINIEITDNIPQKCSEFLVKQITGYYQKMFEGYDWDNKRNLVIRIILTSQRTLVKPGHYILKVEPWEINLLATTTTDLLYAMQSLKQHFLYCSYNTGDIECLFIEDWPSFAWRGLHLDVSRHFFNYKFVRRYLDWMAAMKLNRFHWHLSDDQGWRIESKRFPLLHEIGAWRMESDDTEYGGYYTQRQIRLVLDHAEQRGIEVIPEIDIPGHAMAILAAYPELACFPREFETMNVWGISEDILCAGKDSVIDFLKELFTEIAELFPGPYIHLGGDEAPKTRWKQCPHCQKRIKRHRLENEEQLQGWLLKTLAKHLRSLGKTVIGWDEILDGKIGSQPIVMAWRGDGVEAARKAHDNGNRYVICPNTKLYFDWHIYDSPNTEESGGMGVTTWRDVYELDLSQYRFQKKQLFLGGQANLWTEHITTPKAIKEKVNWRIHALAELFWSDPQPKDWPGFDQRIFDVDDWI